MKKPTWQTKDGNIKLYHADCLDVLKELEPGSVDAVVTDPPYPTWYTEEYTYNESVTNKVLLLEWPILISFWTPGCSFPAKWDSCHAWDKVVGTNTQFELIYLRGLQQGHRLLRFMTPHSSVRAQICGDTKENHKSQKPIRLMIKLLSGLPNLVLDPFMGSGTTGVACVRTGRKFIGVEIDKTYFDIAVKRIQKELRQSEMRFGLGIDLGRKKAKAKGFEL